MKLRIALLAFIAAAGVFASFAVAKPPQGHGHGNPHQGSTTGTTSTGTTTGTTTTTTTPKKVLVCHKTGNGHYVLIRVSVHSAPAKGKHKGDVLASNGTCPGPTQGHGQTTTTATTTAATTTS